VPDAAARPGHAISLPERPPPNHPPPRDERNDGEAWGELEETLTFLALLVRRTGR
jgi:hypothetical protein